MCLKVTAKDISSYVDTYINTLYNKLDENDIYLTRVRGIYLMSEVVKFDNIIDMEEREKGIINHVLHDYFDYPRYRGIDRNAMKKYLGTRKIFTEEIRPRWDLMTRKMRNAIKLKIRNKVEKLYKYYELRNKYLGRDDVIQIYARLGSTNWSGDKWTNHTNDPWFLDGIDDWYDTSYCTIYAKVKVKE